MYIGKLAKCPKHSFMWFYANITIWWDSQWKTNPFSSYKRHLVDVHLQISQMSETHFLHVFKELCGLYLFNRISHKNKRLFRKSLHFLAQCERIRSEEENVRSSKTVTSCDMRWIAVHVPHAIPHLLCFRTVGRPENLEGVSNNWALYAPHPWLI